MEFAENAAEEIMVRMGRRFLQAKDRGHQEFAPDYLTTELELQDIIERAVCDSLMGALKKEVEERPTPVRIAISKAFVLLTDGPDKITLETDKPCPYIPDYMPSQPSLKIGFDATYNTGIEYCRTWLNIEPEVVDIRRK